MKKKKFKMTSLMYQIGDYYHVTQDLMEGRRPVAIKWSGYWFRTKCLFQNTDSIGAEAFLQTITIEGERCTLPPVDVLKDFLSHLEEINVLLGECRMPGIPYGRYWAQKDGRGYYVVVRNDGKVYCGCPVDGFSDYSMVIGCIYA